MLFFTQCRNKEDNNISQLTITAPSNLTKVDTTVIGEWNYNNTIWYSSKLTFSSNGSFLYYDQSCTGQRLSQGLWTKNNNLITLLSFENFNQKVEASNSEVSIRTNPKNSGSNKKNDRIKYRFIEIDTINTPIFPNQNDTIKVFFNKICLELKQDTLYCISSNDILGGTKFYKQKNNR